MQDWLPKAEGIFRADPNHELTAREKKHRRMLMAGKDLRPAVQQETLPADSLKAF